MMLFTRQSMVLPRDGALRPLALALHGMCLSAVSLSGAVAAQGSAPEVPALPDVVVSANYENGVGASDAASEGMVTRSLLQRRPTLRPAEVLEFVPGVIVSQHSGDGKANQYYLRGFNLDHGTDFATHLDGMPVNMPTHAHGQGYTDLNFLIPELLQSIHYRKGLYAAEDGDFSSAGSARLSLVDSLPRGLASVTVGERQFYRALLAKSVALSAGTLLYALEGASNDGPWQNPENYRRFNGVLRYSLAEGGTKHSLTAMAYTSRWRSTDQVPRRAIDSGLIGRYGAIDTSDHGDTRRYSLSWQMLRAVDGGEWAASAYAIRSHLNLLSNFTYYLDNPVEGDQFAQVESRRVLGGSLSRLWQGRLVGLESDSTLGVQWRRDSLRPVGLYPARDGQRTGVTQESRVEQNSVGVYARNETRWLPWLRTVTGVRADRLKVDVTSNIDANSGARGAWVNSPKFSLILGPWARSEFFLNWGQGFHSNDARGITARVTARTREAIDPAVPLVRTQGREIGFRSEWIPGLQSSVALWQLDMASELVFVGDAGETEASGASRRHGVEFNNHYRATPWLMLDLDLALSQARFRQIQGDAPNAGRHVPGAVNKVVSAGATLSGLGPWSGQLQLRYFGPRPLIEDNSVRSQGTTLAYARVGYPLSADTRVTLDVFNLFNRRVSDIDYYYASRLPGEPAEGVSGIHSHPAEPRTLRVTLSTHF